MIRSNRPDGSVMIALEVDGEAVVSAIDSGLGGEPISGPGRVGIRGDNCDFMLDHFRAGPLPVVPAAR